MTATVRSSPFDSLIRRYREFKLIARDPVLLIGLLVIGIFILAFIIWPLARVIVQGFFIADSKPNQGTFNLDQFTRYFSPEFANQYWQIFFWTIQMGTWKTPPFFAENYCDSSENIVPIL